MRRLFGDGWAKWASLLGLAFCLALLPVAGAEAHDHGSHGVHAHHAAPDADQVPAAAPAEPEDCPHQGAGHACHCVAASCTVPVVILRSESLFPGWRPVTHGIVPGAAVDALADVGPPPEPPRA